MATRSAPQGGPGQDIIGVEPVTRARVRARARELAAIAGRRPPHVTPGDCLQAWRELTGEAEKEPPDAIRDAIAEAKRWDPNPAPERLQTTESPDEGGENGGRVRRRAAGNEMESERTTL